MVILHDFKQSGHPNMNEYHRIRKTDMEKKREEGSHQIQSMLTATFGQNNNPFVTPVKPNQNLLHSNAVTFGSNLQTQPTPQLSSPQADFIAPLPQQETNMNKSISKFTVSEKEALRGELLRLRRNWIEELIGGEEEV